jgi:nucleoside-diphosphate-sugar epimerase
VGSFLVRDLGNAGIETVSLSRTANSQGVPHLRIDLGLDGPEPKSFEGFDAIIHCAGRAHIMKDRSKAPIQEFRKANVEVTKRLAKVAKAAGVKRLVFLSSIKVNGEATFKSRPFEADFPTAPSDPYAISKSEAEQALYGVAETGKFDVVIVRPPLIYGMEPKGNMAALIKAIRRGIPVPLASVTNNLRSYVSLANLSSFLKVCLLDTRAANETFLVSDGRDMSTAELIRRLSGVMGYPDPAVRFPPKLLQCGLSLVGKSGIAERLLSDLQVSIEKNSSLLDWRPPYSFEQGFGDFDLIQQSK